MASKFVAICIFLLSSVCLYSQAEHKCEALKSGTFVTTDSIAGKTEIQRLGNMQMEVNKKMGIKFIEKIEWTGSCTYTIHEFEVVQNKGKIRNPSGNFHVKVEPLSDNVFNQMVIIEMYDNFQYSSQITKISDNVSNEFKEVLRSRNIKIPD